MPSTLCGFGFSTPPMEVHVKGNRIIRILPCHLPEDLKIWEIKTDRGVFTRPRKSVPHPHMLAYKNRVYTPTRQPLVLVPFISRVGLHSIIWTPNSNLC
ncbi:MAG: hypothetical protein QXI48_07050 [Candidatus Bathyarchaeia archaeon]